MLCEQGGSSDFSGSLNVAFFLSELTGVSMNNRQRTIELSGFPGLQTPVSLTSKGWRYKDSLCGCEGRTSHGVHRCLCIVPLPLT